MWRRPNSPTMYMHPGGNGLASTDGEAMAIASPSFFSLRRNPASAIATPVAQERGEDYQIRIDKGGIYFWKRIGQKRGEPGHHAGREKAKT